MLEINGYLGMTFPRWMIKRVSPLNKGFCIKLRISFPDNGFQCCELLEELTLSFCEAVFLLDLSPLTKLHFLCDELSKKQTRGLVGLENLPYLRELKTDQSQLVNLDEHSPLFNPSKNYH
ncbi:Leucine-rich repeat and IQ domain-containing protein 1 [Bienertia sinuspersici]